VGLWVTRNELAQRPKDFQRLLELTGHRRQLEACTKRPFGLSSRYFRALNLIDDCVITDIQMAGMTG
jgi:hypothetical protein